MIPSSCPIATVCTFASLPQILATDGVMRQWDLGKAFKNDFDKRKYLCQRYHGSQFNWIKQHLIVNSDVTFAIAIKHAIKFMKLHSCKSVNPLQCSYLDNILYMIVIWPRIVYDSTGSSCGGDLTTPTGSFVSPNYPSPYGHSAECIFTITVARGSRIQLAFVDFDLESNSNCRYDYVLVWQELFG